MISLMCYEALNSSRKSTLQTRGGGNLPLNGSAQWNFHTSKVLSMQPVYFQGFTFEKNPALFFSPVLLRRLKPKFNALF